MRSSLIATKGLKLVRSPSARQEAARRRLAVLGAVVSLAVLSGLVGHLTAPPSSVELAARTGPFSYFPSQ